MGVNDLAFVVGRGCDDLVGPGVVSHAVLDDQIGGSKLRCHLRVDLERVWIRIGIRFDRAHLNVLAADLGDDVGVLVFDTDGVDYASRC
ncbi:hypothetical protein OKW39_005734 [Paraburkholderia sp. MM6662-R1]